MWIFLILLLTGWALVVLTLAKRTARWVFTAGAIFTAFAVLGDLVDYILEEDVWIG
ncbi:MAG: hypothetical protein PVF54_10200 [Anaerolineae bacterium]|jgi:hypothetical protein